MALHRDEAVDRYETKIRGWKFGLGLSILRAVFLRFSTAVLLALALVGCSGARPWERETLAKRKMQFNEDPEAVQLEQHVYQYREGSTGGYGTSGGGCGCN